MSQYAMCGGEVKAMLAEYGIPKSTFNQWLREYDVRNKCNSKYDFSPRNFRNACTRYCPQICLLSRNYDPVVMFSVRHELLKDVLCLHFHISCCSSVAAAVPFWILTDLRPVSYASGPYHLQSISSWTICNIDLQIYTNEKRLYVSTVVSGWGHWSYFIGFPPNNT